MVVNFRGDENFVGFLTWYFMKVYVHGVKVKKVKYLQRLAFHILEYQFVNGECDGFNLTK